MNDKFSDEQYDDDEMEAFEDEAFDEDLSDLTDDYDDEEDEDALDEGDWGFADEEPEDFQPQGPGKKKRSFLNLVIIGGGVLAGIGILGAQMGLFSKTPSIKTPRAQVSSSATTQGAAQNPAGVAGKGKGEEKTVEMKGMLTNPEIFFGTEKDDSEEKDREALAKKALKEDPSRQVLEKSPDYNPEQPASAQQAKGGKIVAGPMAGKEALSKALLPLPTAKTTETAEEKAKKEKEYLENLPWDKAKPKKAPAPAGKIRMPKAEEVMVEKTVAKAGTEKKSEGNSEDLRASVSSLQNQIKAMETKLDSVQTSLKSEPSTAVATENTKMLQSISNTLKSLQARFKDLEDSQEKTQAQLSVLSERRDFSAGVEEKLVKKQAVPEALPPVSVPTGVSGAASLKMPEMPAKAHAESARWILKSAVPGGALISSGKQGETLNVKVGDVVPGIGKIQAIETVDGRWVVRGSKGEILQ